MGQLQRSPLLVFYIESISVVVIVLSTPEKLLVSHGEYPLSRSVLSVAGCELSVHLEHMHLIGCFDGNRIIPTVNKIHLVL